MTGHAGALLGVYAALLLALAWPLSRWIGAVMEGRIGWASRIEAPLLRAAGVRADSEMGWLPYAVDLLIFNGSA